MELKDFIKNTLTEIAKGIEEANTELGQKIYCIEAYKRDSSSGYIHFDIAVTVEEELNGKVEGGIKVLEVGFGSKAEGKYSSENISKIKFSVMPQHGIN